MGNNHNIYTTHTPVSTAMTDTPSLPPTPLHPAPNQEVSHRLPTDNIPSSTALNLDLNPELYDDDDDDDDKDAEMTDSTSNVQQANNGIDDDDDDDEGFEDVKLDLKTFTIPFDTAFELVKLDFEKKNSNGNGPTGSITTEVQQSKFINYLDEELLKVQRKFIKNVADMENRQLYSIFELTNDLNHLVDLIWYSINDSQPRFGQSHYLIKMMNDLEDYIGHESFTNLISTSSASSTSILSKENNIKLIKFFNFLQALDVRLSFLIDGYTNRSNNKLEKLQSTEFIRLIPITSRLRILSISKLEPLRTKLVGILNAPKTSLPARQQATDLVNLFEVEIGRLFEGILDRGN